MKVAILMSTYNGERYLKEQIQSLQAQTYSNWQLFVRDDGSTDKTVSLINDIKKYDSRIHFIDDNKKQLRPMKSFLLLLKKVSADFYFFCDQDDYWLPEKLEKMLQCGTLDDPQLVYCGLKCVDQNLKSINNDFENMMGKIWGLSRFIGNDMPGCVMMINSKLRDIVISSLKNYDGIIMHDWWIALIAQSFGKIEFIDEKLILYRQHGDNSIGAGTNGSLIKKIMQPGVLKKQEKIIKQTYQQAVAFNATFKENMPNDTKLFLNDYINAPQQDIVYRNKLFIKYKLSGASKIRLLVYRFLFVFNLNNILGEKDE